jgi:type IV pilus assembly protein PilV
MAMHGNRQQSRGFTLIEALVTLLVLSIGLLGVVSLQAMAKKSNHQALQRSQAVALADAMVEKIRINPTALGTYETGVADALGGGTQSTPTVDCRTAACDPDELATWDLWSWEQALDGAMVSGSGGGLIQPQGCIVFDEYAAWANSGQLNVIVSWLGTVDTTDAVATGGTVCGTATGGAAAGTEMGRRQVSVQTFIIDEREL